MIVNMDLNEEINFDKNSSTLEQFFAKNRLSDYLNQFIESGYDDMSFILDTNEAEVFDMLKDGEVTKVGHIKKFIAVWKAAKFSDNLHENSSAGNENEKAEATDAKVQAI